MAKPGRKPDKKKPGPKPALNDKLFKKIRELIIEGKKLKEIANECKIPESSLYTWHSDNYLNLADKIEGWKRDRKLLLAEKNIENVLEMDIEEPVITMIGTIKDEEGNIIKKKNSALLKIKNDTSIFVAETLGKDLGYSKRHELTGKDGEALVVNVLQYGANDPLQLDTGKTSTASSSK